MYRGRLEICRPDGPIENYFVEKETIAIGRSAGNDLIFDRKGISRYHISLTVKDQQTVLEDLESVNGTYVDGLRLKSNEPRLLRGGEEIQIGDMRLIFHPAYESDATLRMRVQTLETDTFRVEMEGPDIAVTPGAHAPATLKFENISSQSIRILIEVDGIPKEWVRLDRSEFDLPAGETTQVGMTFKPLRRPEAMPGDYSLAVQTYARIAPDHVIELSARVQVLQYNGYGVAMGTQLIDHHHPFQLYIHNQGNGPLNLLFRGVSREHPLQFAIHPPQLTLGPGERQTIVGRVQAVRRPLLGGTSIHRYDVISQSLDAAGFQAPVSGQFKVTPILPLWSLLAAIPALLAIIALAFVVIMSLLGDSDDNDSNETSPLPVIMEFQASDQITLGDSILVDWHVEDAEQITVEVQRGVQPVGEYVLPGRQGTGFAISDVVSAGQYTITLIAENGDNIVTDRLGVAVSPQLILSISTFPDGEVLYRNVTGQQLTVEWQIIWDPGNTSSAAPTVLLNSPDLGIDLVPQTESSYSISVPVLDSLEVVPISLHVQGPDGVDTVETRTLPVAYVTCQIINNATQENVFQDPSTAFPLTTLPAGESIQIDGRSPDAEWFHILIPEDHIIIGYFGWMRVADLDCGAALNPTWLQIFDDLPTDSSVPSTGSPPPGNG